MSTETLESELAKLFGLRAALKELEQERAELETDFRRAHSALYEALAALEKQVEEQDAKVRGLALDCYRETGKHQPVNGVTIRKEIGCEYDETQAIKWCAEHPDMLPLLQLRRSQFEQVARRLQLDFVKLKEVLKVFITKGNGR
ncbi:MAG: hypothetical protein ONB52_21990 [candidate division KSB1 bacterium]|nr:hypothetical protein [candidate division KSB1 bacterium]